jgi:hypothetical protein
VYLHDDWDVVVGENARREFGTAVTLAFVARRSCENDTKRRRACVPMIGSKDCDRRRAAIPVKSAKSA